MEDQDLQLFIAAMDSLNQSVSNATNIVATENLNRDNRKWQGKQAELARNWSSKEAELAYERQLEYYDSKLSPSAQVQQYKDAGINPALMYKGGASSSSSSAPQASPAGSPSGHPATFQPMQVFSMLDAIMNIQRQKAEIANIEADTEEKNERTKGYEGERQLTLQKIKESISQTLNNDADTENKKADLVNIINQSDLMSAQVDELMSRSNLNREQADYFISMSEKVRSEVDSIIQQVQFFDDNKAYFKTQNEADSLRHQFLAKLAEYDEQLRKWSQPDQNATGWGKVWNVWKGFKTEVKSILDSCFGWFGGASVSKVVK